ncbi:unnamed protein product [Ambrosiozyma monospora]|uniref:Unnamed protein product n=1 Tax=Ambrosiozyma monospora TaxID=43982 RepID=A0A9W6Z4X6_AMBMO|nr:unnamed protein product [Ambrosiozyma monospora]
MPVTRSLPKISIQSSDIIDDITASTEEIETDPATETSNAHSRGEQADEETEGNTFSTACKVDNVNCTSDLELGSLTRIMSLRNLRQ